MTCCIFYLDIIRPNKLKLIKIYIKKHNYYNRVQWILNKSES